MARRNPNWTAEEIVLATELLLKHDFRVVGEHHPDVRELSNLLNRLPIYSEERRNDEFRSPSSVDLTSNNVWKLMGFDRPELLRPITYQINDLRNTIMHPVRPFVVSEKELHDHAAALQAVDALISTIMKRIGVQTG